MVVEPEARWASRLAATGVVLGVCLSVKIALANVFLALGLIGWLVALWRGEVRWRHGAVNVAAVAYVVASLAAVVLSQDPWHSVSEVGELATLLLVPMLVTLLDRRLWNRMLVGLAVVASVSSLVGLWQYLRGASSLASRLSGLTTHYMTFSGWTLVVTLLLVGDMAFNRDRRRLLWTTPVVFLSTAALLLSFTRNAWVGLAAGLVLVAAVWRPKALYLYPPVAVALVLLVPRPVIERAISIVDLRQPSNYDRLCMMISGQQMVQDYPFFGVGLGMVERRYPLYREEDAPRWRVPHLHNNLLQIAAERGLLGVVGYLAMLATFAIHTWRALRRPQPVVFPALAGCFLAVAGITVAGLFEYNWGDSEVWVVTLTALAAPFALTSEQEHLAGAPCQSAALEAARAGPTCSVLPALESR